MVQGKTNLNSNQGSCLAPMPEGQTYFRRGLFAFLK
jgi:hypothetical protein